MEPCTKKMRMTTEAAAVKTFDIVELEANNLPLKNGPSAHVDIEKAVVYLVPLFSEKWDDKVQISVHINYGKSSTLNMRAVGYVPDDMLDQAHAEKWVDRKWKVGDVKHGMQGKVISMSVLMMA
jgi:hypothetical protein|eukprot:SAG25_NODE_7941_length_449_cov_0.731429_1_plen_124_part_00